MKKKVLLVPSAYSYKAIGDIEGFAKYYKNDFEVYILQDRWFAGGERIIDGVHYVHKGAPQARYLVSTADYIIDAGTVNGYSKCDSSQTRVSVWHGIPYKNMFVDLAKKHALAALDYSSTVDMMISPSEWYTNRFLRESMLYNGKVLETAVSRTDSLFIPDSKKKAVKAMLDIPLSNRILLYAPTFREEGVAQLPFSEKRLLEALGGGWSVVTKYHYLNELELDDDSRIIDATSYPFVNNLLAVADFVVTDYSSLLFDYSMLDKPALLYQYDWEEYRENRGFMFDLEDYIDPEGIARTEEEFYSAVAKMDALGSNLSRIKEHFYPHQKPDATEDLVRQLAFEPEEREINEVIFLVNELNQVGGVHGFVLGLAKEFKKRHNAKIIVIGAKEFASTGEDVHLFDPNNDIDIKLSGENDITTIAGILENTEGYIISCQYSAHLRFQNYLKGKKTILMFHGDTKDVVNRTLYGVHLDAYNYGGATNFRRLVFLSRKNWELIDGHLVGEARAKATYIENGIDTSATKSLYRESGAFAFVSRLDPDKNPLAVLDIFSDKSLNPSYHLHVYGNGSLKNEMEEQAEKRGIQDKITFHGYVSNQDEIYRDKQGVIMVGLSEGLPLTVFEAAKHGIPVYTYDSFTSCHDVVTDETGVIVKTNDIQEYVAALNDPFDIATFNNRKILEQFSSLIGYKRQAPKTKRIPKLGMMLRIRTKGKAPR